MNRDIAGYLWAWSLLGHLPPSRDGLVEPPRGLNAQGIEWCVVIPTTLAIALDIASIVGFGRVAINGPEPTP